MTFIQNGALSYLERHSLFDFIAVLQQKLCIHSIDTSNNLKTILGHGHWTLILYNKSTRYSLPTFGIFVILTLPQCMCIVYSPYVRLRAAWCYLFWLDIDSKFYTSTIDALCVDVYLLWLLSHIRLFESIWRFLFLFDLINLYMRNASKAKRMRKYS